jgi:hypothetical protein
LTTIAMGARGRSARQTLVRTSAIPSMSAAIARLLVPSAAAPTSSWLAWEVEVEVRGQPRRARGPGQNDAEDVGVLVVRDDRPEGEQLTGGSRSKPAADVAVPRGRSLRRSVH